MEAETHSAIPFSEDEQVRAAKNDLRCFKPLYDKYFPVVFRFVYSRMDSRDDAADITSSVFLKAMTKFESYASSTAPLGCWLCTIARNEVASFYRKKKSEQRYFANRDGIETIAQAIDFDLPESYFSIRNLLEMLPPDDFELIELKYFQGKSVREIALITQGDENRIRVRLHRIRERMGKWIRRLPEGYTLRLVSILCFLTTFIV